jgi:hypothetical protein
MVRTFGFLTIHFGNNWLDILDLLLILSEKVVVQSAHRGRNESLLFHVFFLTQTFRLPCILIFMLHRNNRFCGLKGHEMFCEVERSYIEDGFNLYGLRTCVSNFSDCLDLILDRIGPDDSDDSHLTQSACTLYGLIHARYIITAHGLDAMYNKVSSSSNSGKTQDGMDDR